MRKAILIAYIMCWAITALILILPVEVLPSEVYDVGQWMARGFLKLHLLALIATGIYLFFCWEPRK